MATEVIVPTLGEVVKEVIISRWLKAEGDRVSQGEALLEVESEKVTVEVESPAAGTLGKILFPQGAKVPVTHVVAVVLAPGESLPERYGRAAGSAAGAGPSPSRADMPRRDADEVRAVPLARRLARQHNIDLALVSPSGPHNTVMKKDVEAYLDAAKAEASKTEARERVKVSPLARTMATKEGLDLAVVRGTGAGGKIVKEDVIRAIGEREAGSRKVLSPKAETTRLPGKEALETIPIKGARRVIFDNMTMSLSRTAQLTLHTEAGAEALVDLRERLNQRGSRPAPTISYNAILVKIAATVLRRHPGINASVEDDQIVVWRQVNVGVAMESEDGLVVPVIRNSDLKSVAEINEEILGFTAKTRERRLLPDDLAFGTFTISNLGFADIDYFTPVLRPPESALLGVGRIVAKPTVRAGQVVPERRLGLSLTFDHRIIDGAPAARFLKTIKEIIESPVLMVA